MRFTRWDQSLSTEVTNDQIKELALWHLGQCSPSAERERIAGFIAGDSFASLCDMDLDYRAIEPSDAYHLNQALAFYRKRVDLDIGVDREAVALEKFQIAEELCCETNEVFRKWAQGGFYFLPGTDSKLFAAQRKIAYCLGDLPSLSELKLRFGPGATTQVKKRIASPRYKLGQTLACSEDLIPLLPELLAEMPQWVFGLDNPEAETALVSVEIHDGVLSFVPKNAKTDRSIVVEPMLNSMVQLGIGDVIAARLKRCGIDISDQTRNQKLARTGSITGLLATLDLSSASDTVSRELVRHLLPDDWFTFLDRARTSHVSYKGESRRLQKFSSMGNGFTFPLETLIFWALASVCVDADEQDNVSVYGDDIIVPVSAFESVCSLLRTCGFVPNPDKSFASGPFRESCGKDYLSGIDIRPVFLKDRLMGADAFVLHNFYVRTGYPEAAAIVLSWMDPSLILWGPDGYGDGHLVASHSQQRATLRPHKRGLGWAGYTFETYSWKGRKSFVPSPGDYVFPSYSIYMGHESDPLAHPHLGLIIRGGGDRIEPGDRATVLRSVDEFTGRCSASTWRQVEGGDMLGVTLPGTRGYKRVKIYTLGLL